MNEKITNNSESNATNFSAQKNVRQTGYCGIHTFRNIKNIVISTAMRLLLLAAPLMMILLSNTTAFSQDKTGEVDQIFSWATPATPGCVCAVSQNGKVVVNRAYGSADLEREVPLSSTSIFDAGSVVKQFVAASILLLVEEGKLSLSDEVRKHIPQLPDYGKKITLDHLLTHTSGIRDWTGILPLTPGNEDALTLILRQQGLNFAPGSEWSYSNSGYVLLKEIIARTSKTSFDEFIQKRLLEPLGMKHTAYHTNLRTIVKNRSLAYEKDRSEWRIAMKLDNDRGGGGALLSTAGDLLIWNDALTNNRLGQFVTGKLHEPATLNTGRKLGYSRGLFFETYRGIKEISHTGGAGGYSTWLGRYPEQNLSIAIMCNADEVSTTALAHRIAALYLSATGVKGTENTLPPVAADNVDTAALDLSSKAGLFFSESADEPIRLVVDRGRLRVANGPALVAQAKDRFKRWGAALEFMSGDEFTVTFRSQDNFELKSMEGKTIRYHRARPYIPKGDELKAFAGRFGSAEIGTIFKVEAKDNGLIMRLEHSPSRSLEFKPFVGDNFLFGRIMLRFHRDKTGKVISIGYSNPLVRNIKFIWLSEQIIR